MNFKETPQPDPKISSVVGVDGVQELEVVDKIAKDKSLNIIGDDVGRVYFGGEKFKSGPDQMLIARLLKGIVNVSDIVYVKDTDSPGFYSYKAPIDKVQHKEARDHSKEVVEKAKVDLALLQIIFSDFDHIVNEIQRINENFIYENGEYAFFDFEPRNFWSIYATWDYSKYKELCEYRIKFIEKSRLPFFLEKVHEMKERIQSGFFEEVLNSVRKYTKDDESFFLLCNAPGENKVESLKNELLRRIDIILEL
jgi:hypothetical protein